MAELSIYSKFDDTAWYFAGKYQPLPGSIANFTGVTIRAICRRQPEDEALLFDLSSVDADHVQVTGPLEFVLRLDPAQLGAIRGTKKKDTAFVGVYGIKAGAAPFELAIFRLEAKQGLLR